MVENWELRSVERRLDSLEKPIERDRECARAEKEEARAERWRRQERRMDLSTAIFWTVLVAVVTAYIVPTSANSTSSSRRPHLAGHMSTPTSASGYRFEARPIDDTGGYAWDRRAVVPVA